MKTAIDQPTPPMGLYELHELEKAVGYTQRLIVEVRKLHRAINECLLTIAVHGDAEKDIILIRRILESVSAEDVNNTVGWEEMRSRRLPELTGRRCDDQTDGGLKC